VKETGVAIQLLFNQVNNLNRERSPKYITVNYKASNSRIGNELRRDLRIWIAPPDPSVNFNTASDAHHEGTATWCTKGDTVVTWKECGTLLWIHSKRTYPIQFTVRASVITNDILINSWLWEKYSQVCHSQSSCVPVVLIRAYRQAP
jgi:hypothetical protein